MLGGGIWVGVDGRTADTVKGCGARNAEGDFTAVGDKDGGYGCRWWRGRRRYGCRELVGQGGVRMGCEKGHSSYGPSTGCWKHWGVYLSYYEKIGMMRPLVKEIEAVDLGGRRARF